jgi:hypothetical protein
MYHLTLVADRTELDRPDVIQFDDVHDQSEYYDG